jgi:2-amino-4-hydroxy-6-hydroxymethyldihydropteridine diphosphokinase
MVTEAILSLGGNLGNREQTLFEAIQEISALKKVKLVHTSSFYETVALTLAGEDENAPKFLNCVIKIETELTPKKLLKKLFEIENNHGRVRLERWGPRTLDIDIIVFGNEFVQTKSLQIPHPRTHQRGFVLIPWAEIDPEAVLPGHGKVSKLAERFRSSVQEI